MGRVRHVTAWVLASVMVLVWNAATARAGDEKPTTSAEARQRVVEITLSGVLAEQGAPFELFTPQTLSMGEVLEAMNRAKADQGVAGLSLRLDGPTLGFAQVQSLRSKVLEVRAAGKKVFCLLQEADHGQYLIATAADRIGMVPAGGLDLVGLSVDSYFFKGLLDKIGVQADLLQVGDYKGAAEPFTRTTMSPELRQNLTALVDDLYWLLVADIADGRKLSARRVESLIDGGPYLPADAVKEGLADWTVYPDEFDTKVRGEFSARPRIVKERFGRPGLSSEAMANPMALLTAVFSGLAAPAAEAPSGRPRIAVVYVTGPIVTGDEEVGLLGGVQAAAEPIVLVLRRARRDPTVKAVILRIDSPGGSVLASDLIWHEVAACAAEKPVIASMGNTAASGGYYVAAPATAIVAEPGTITGSIGVVGGKVVLGGLYDKIGVHKETVSRGRRAGLASETAPFTDEERQHLTRLVKRVYDDFVAKVAAGRKMPRDKVEAVAQGRLWSGSSAKRVGLVDDLGGMEKAVRLARSKAGLAPDAEVEFVHWPARKGFLQRLLGGGLGVSAPSADGLALPPGLGPRDLARLAPLLTAADILRRERVAAVMPFIIEIK